MFDKEKTCNGGKERKSDTGIKAKTGHRLWDVLTFTGVTVAVGGSQPLQLYCHRHRIAIVIIVSIFVVKSLLNHNACPRYIYTKKIEDERSLKLKSSQQEICGLTSKGGYPPCASLHNPQETTCERTRPVQY